MENRSAEISWLEKNIKRYRELGTFIPQQQHDLYEKIRDGYVMGRTVVDIGCSSGFGSNILSHFARHVWGLDINKESIDFARLVFSRPNLSFEVFNVERPENSRPLSSFEVVTMIEVIEHLSDPDSALSTLKGFFSDKLNTIGFITVPNINNEVIKKADAENDLHIQHWTPGEFYAYLIQHFRSVTLFGNKRIKQWSQEETVDGNDFDSTIIVAKVEGAIK